jgi:UDP-glucose 4-epimerase
MAKDKVLVTGAAGFIGSHVAQALLAAGHQVRTIDNFSTGSRGNLAAVRGDRELVEGDIRSYERTHTATQGMDVVIHLAALPSVPRSVQDPLTTNDVNVTGTLNVVLAARDAGVRRVVIASSSSVYGRNDALPKTETLVPMPISPYGVSKLAAEQYCMGFSAVYGIEAVALRFSTRLSNTRATWLMRRPAVSGGCTKVNLVGKSSSRRDLVKTRGVRTDTMVVGTRTRQGGVG